MPFLNFHSCFRIHAATSPARLPTSLPRVFIPTASHPASPSLSPTSMSLHALSHIRTLYYSCFLNTTYTPAPPPPTSMSLLIAALSGAIGGAVAVTVAVFIVILILVIVCRKKHPKATSVERDSAATESETNPALYSGKILGWVEHFHYYFFLNFSCIPLHITIVW